MPYSTDTLFNSVIQLELQNIQQKQADRERSQHTRREDDKSVAQVYEKRAKADAAKTKARIENERWRMEQEQLQAYRTGMLETRASGVTSRATGKSDTAAAKTKAAAIKAFQKKLASKQKEYISILETQDGKLLKAMDKAKTHRKELEKWQWKYSRKASMAEKAEKQKKISKLSVFIMETGANMTKLATFRGELDEAYNGGFTEYARFLKRRGKYFTTLAGYRLDYTHPYPTKVGEPDPEEKPQNGNEGEAGTAEQKISNMYKNNPEPVPEPEPEPTDTGASGGWGEPDASSTGSW